MAISQHSLLLLLALLALVLDVAVDACQSCLMEMTVSGLFRNNAKNNDDYIGIAGKQEIFHSSALPLGLLGNPRPLYGSTSRPSKAMMFLAVRKLTSVVAHNNKVSTDGRVMKIPHNQQSIHMKGKWAGGLFIDAKTDSTDSEGNDVDESDDSAGPNSEDKGEEVMSGSMIMAIGFYKQWISPLLPPACRFLPTCSQYGVQAIKEFGPQKGLILTAWRLARCSPFGGRGYDPPRWPPVAYTYGSY